MSLWCSEPLTKQHGLFEEKVVLCFYFEVRIYMQAVKRRAIANKSLVILVLFGYVESVE